VAARLAGLEMPCVYLAGVPDGASPGSLEALRAAGVALREIRPSGHWPFIDQEESFLDELIAFVGGVDSVIVEPGTSSKNPRSGLTRP
jgi:pimeloyl-ACP methyl ester carboxylesterase